MERYASAIDRVPPQNLNAEQSTLGSMMIERWALEKGQAILVAEDFYRPNHQEIFDALCELNNNSVPADLITLQEELRRRGKLEDCGGTEYLMALADAVPTAANIEHYARIVREKSLLRKQLALGTTLQGRIASGEYDDPRDVIGWLSTELDRINLDRGIGLRSISASITEHFGWLAEQAEKEGLQGYTTGFSHLDTVTGGFGQPMFTVLKGYRGEGKTQLLIQTCVNCIRSGKAVALFSMDTPWNLMQNRFIAHLSGIDARKLRKMGAEDWDVVTNTCGVIYKWPLYYDDRAGITVSEIRAKCKSLVSQGFELGLVGIDYAEKVGSEKVSSNYEQELSDIAWRLTNLRGELNTTIMLLSQINEQGAERWSKSIGNQCDLLLSWKTDEISGGRGTGTLLAEKNRLGPGIKVGCVFDFGTSRIREMALDYSDPSYPPSWPWWHNAAEALPPPDPDPEFEY